MGIDSLMAMEIRSRLQDLLGSRLPATLVFDYPSVDEMTRYIHTEILAEVKSLTVVTSSRVDATSPAMADEALDALSEQELEALLMAKIAALE